MSFSRNMADALLILRDTRKVVAFNCFVLPSR